jgi:hypothetical protein
MPVWTAADTALRLIEKARAPADPAPNALACYGLLVRALPTAPEQLWLRFARGQPGSALTPQFLAWCCELWAAPRMRALLLVWDHASWHPSQRVRTWVREHPRQVKQQGWRRGSPRPLQRMVRCLRFVVRSRSVDPG